MKALELLRDMVAIPSVNPFRYGCCGERFVGLGAETAMNLFVESALSDAGFAIERQVLHDSVTARDGGGEFSVPSRWNVLGTRAPKGTPNGKSLLLFGHTDTVDVKLGWKSDPFTITPGVVDNREVWYGLGSNDMKGGLAAILDAVSTGYASEYTIKVAFLVDEEFYSFGADFLCQSSFLDDVELAVAPEIGEVVASPDAPQWVGLGRTGRVEFDFQVQGRACHGADAFVAADAVNAVHASAQLQAALVDDCRRARRVYSAHGVQCLNSAYLSYQVGGEPMLSVPDRASFVLDRTLLPDETATAELHRLRALVSELQAEGCVDPRATITIEQRFRPTAPCEPYFTSPNLPAVRKLLAIVDRQWGGSTLGIGRSVADENRIALRGVPTITMGPSGSGSHTAHEWVDPQSVVRVADVLRELLTAS